MWRFFPRDGPAHFLSTSSKSASTTPGSDDPPESPAPGGGASAGPPFPYISYAVFCLKKKKQNKNAHHDRTEYSYCIALPTYLDLDTRYSLLAASLHLY